MGKPLTIILSYFKLITAGAMNFNRLTTYKIS
jgi:hypothetical protein